MSQSHANLLAASAPEAREARGGTCPACGLPIDGPDRRRTEETLRTVALGVSAATGEALFQAIVRYLSLALGVDFAFVGEVVSDPLPRVQTLAMAHRGGVIVDNLAYDLRGTPCESVVATGFQYIPDRVCELYPGENMLAAYGLKSYAGYPLPDSAGRAVGVVSVVHREPLRDRDLVESMLQIFAVRAGAELERLRVEGQLRQAQKMEAIGQLTGGIAHDFNNILTGVMGYIALARERVESLGDAKLLQYLDRAERSGYRARDLIQQMLTFSRGGRGEPRPLSLRALVGEAVKLLGSTFPATIEIRTELEPATPPVLLDPVQAEQVLMNLCINARDAMNASGPLTVSVRPVTQRQAVCASCRQVVAGDFVELAVRDAGPGIAEAVIERMFEPFFSTKEKAKGSGMGLAVVHGIVHEHGGHILVDTTRGAGTAFRVQFPPLAGPEVLSPETVTPPPRVSARLGGRVLLVDDDEAAGAFMQDLLEGWGLTVARARDGAEGQERFCADPGGYDLAVLDQSMPRLTGTELSAEIAHHRPGFPVILYTGNADALTAEELRCHGVRALVRKPVDTRELLELLSDILRGSG